MTKARHTPRQPKEPPKGVLTKPRSVRFVTIMAFVLPGSGQVFNGAPYRGIFMQFGMVFGAFITYMLTTPEISPVGRMAGGLLMYVFSIVDANGIAKLRVKAWERIEAQAKDGPREDTTVKAAGKPASGGKHKKRAGGARRTAGSGPAAPAAEDGEAREAKSGASTGPASPERTSG